ncbi:MAG: STAS-like domain-containing protein [Elusimicrobia bacterium]|nr:STAS-like domain-containing protein [Elusimicrobiota bacterium]
MRIHLRDFGQILGSRPAGREAALAMRAYLKPAKDETIELDFEGVLSVGPSWLDEVLSALRRDYGKTRVVVLPTTNASVIESLKILDEG